MLLQLRAAGTKAHHGMAPREAGRPVLGVGLPSAAPGAHHHDCLTAEVMDKAPERGDGTLQAHTH